MQLGLCPHHIPEAASGKCLCYWARPRPRPTRSKRTVVAGWHSFFIFGLNLFHILHRMLGWHTITTANRKFLSHRNCHKDWMNLQVQIKTRAWTDSLWLRAHTALVGDPWDVPACMLGSSQPPVIVSLEDWIPSYGPWCCMYACVHTNTETHII